MDVMITIAAVAAVLNLVVTGFLAGFVVRDRRPRVEAPSEPVFDYAALPDPTELRTERKTRSNVQLTEPPMIDGLTLRDWLIHQSGREGIWADVVTEFYNRAASVPEIKEYFEPTIERGGMEPLQRHFLAALLIVTHSGITEGIVNSMREAHRGVVNRDEQPINSVIYDAVINTLVEILREVGVPTQAINDLADTIQPLRAAIAR